MIFCLFPVLTAGFVYISICYVNVKVSILAKEGWGFEADPESKPSVRSWHAPCMTDSQMAGLSVSTAVTFAALLNSRSSFYG